MLEVQGLSVSYGKHRALANAALRVGKGEVVVILGANGAGKTTLLKAICGISEGHATGSVQMDGQELVGEKPHRIVEAGIALVPEGRGIFGDLTVQENLLLGAYAERARYDEAGNVERVFTLFPKLAERRRQTVRTMSGGEQQMVAIGRAMMSNPRILALDEPSLGLSPLLCKDLFESLKTLKMAGLGILLVEQNAKQSLRIADRGYLLENGNIVHEDDADRLGRDPAVQKAYLGGRAAARGARRAAQAAMPVASSRPASGPAPRDIAAAAVRNFASPSPPGAPHRSEPCDSAPSAQPLPAQPKAPPPAAAAPRPNGGAGPMPAPTPAAPDIGDLVARASARASRRPSDTARMKAAAPQRPAAPPPPPDRASIPPMPVPGPSADRLRSVLDEIEAAARRAETYKPRDPRR